MKDFHKYNNKKHTVLMLLLTILFTVLASGVSAQSYKLVTSTNDLAVGDEVIIVNESRNVAMGGIYDTQYSVQRKLESVTINNHAWCFAEVRFLSRVQFILILIIMETRDYKDLDINGKINVKSAVNNGHAMRCASYERLMPSQYTQPFSTYMEVCCFGQKNWY